MMNKNLQILGLSKSEEKVFTELARGTATPLLLHKATGVSRTAVYNILDNLNKRRLIERYKLVGKFYYRTRNARELSGELYNLKHELLGQAGGRSELAITNDSDLVVHRGIDTIRTSYKQMFDIHKNKKFIGVQGGEVIQLYKETLGTKYINDINKKIKQNKMIVEGIIGDNWREKVVTHFDSEWAEHYTGRTANIHEIESKYFNHLGEIFVYGDTVYLISIADEMMIELSHSHIAKVITSLIKYITDHTRTININEEVRKSFKK